MGICIEEKRRIIENLSTEYPIKTICETIDCSRSSFYYKEDVDEENGLKKAIEKVIVEFPTYGYRRATEQLKREGYSVNHKRILRLMKEMGLVKKLKRRKCKTTNSQHDYRRYPNLVRGTEVFHIDQIWVADITYIRLKEEFIYLAVIMDVYTRSIRGWNLSRSLDAQLSLDALKQALNNNKPKIHHSDQGIQYAATVYTDLLEQNDIQISMADVGQAWQNGYCERINRTIKEEEIDLSVYLDFSDAYQNIRRFLEDVYMKKRIHSALAYLTPAEFEEKCRTKNNGPKFLYK